MPNISREEKEKIGDAIAHELMALPEIVRQIPKGATLHVQVRWNDDDLTTNLPWAICMGLVSEGEPWPEHLVEPKSKKRGDWQIDKL